MSIFGGKEAENLTAEIDRVTDAAMLAEREVAEVAEKARAAKMGDVARIGGAAMGDVAKTSNMAKVGDVAKMGGSAAEMKAAEIGAAEAGKSVDGAQIEAEELADRARMEAAKTEIHELEQGLGWQAGEISAETRALGGAALEQAVIASNEAIKEQVAIENGYVDAGLEAGRNVIGGESKKQIIERSQEDLKDAKMEEKVDLPPELMREANILTKNQENLAKGAVVAMDNMLRRRDVKPYQMERWAWEARMKMLETFGRTERN